MPAKRNHPSNDKYIFLPSISFLLINWYATTKTHTSTREIPAIAIFSNSVKINTKMRKNSKNMVFERGRKINSDLFFDDEFVYFVSVWYRLDWFIIEFQWQKKVQSGSDSSIGMIEQ